MCAFLEKDEPDPVLLEVLHGRAADSYPVL